MTANQVLLEFNPKALSDPTFQRLPPLAGRIGRLLASNPQPRRSLQVCLDDLLGAVYSLMYAKHYEFDDHHSRLLKQTSQRCCQTKRHGRVEAANGKKVDSRLLFQQCLISHVWCLSPYVEDTHRE